jgi:hypothetical protein
MNDQDCKFGYVASMLVYADSISPPIVGGTWLGSSAASPQQNRLKTVIMPFAPRAIPTALLSNPYPLLPLPPGPILSLAVTCIRSLEFSMEPFVADPHSALLNRVSLRNDS